MIQITNETAENISRNYSTHFPFGNFKTEISASVIKSVEINATPRNPEVHNVELSLLIPLLMKPSISLWE